MGYSKIKLNGCCDINFVLNTSKLMSNTDISNVVNIGFDAPVWDAHTNTLSTFQDSIDASNINSNNTVSGYRIQRQDNIKNKIYYVTTLGRNDTFVQDYNVRGNGDYNYIITPLFSNGTQGSYITTDEIIIDWDGWNLINIIPTEEDGVFTVDKGNVWNFKYNFKGQTITPQYDKNFTVGAGKFPRSFIGQRNYLEGSFECLIGDVDYNNNYINDTIEKIERWREFCNDGNLKLLRDIKGNIIPCDIKDTSISIDDTSDLQPTTISFSYTQLADANNISVYSTEV